MNITLTMARIQTAETSFVYISPLPPMLLPSTAFQRGPVWRVVWPLDGITIGGRGEMYTQPDQNQTLLLLLNSFHLH